MRQEGAPEKICRAPCASGKAHLHVAGLGSSSSQVSIRVCFGIAFGLILPGCSTPGPTGANAAAQFLPASESYVRLSDAVSNIVQLQIAVRKFVPARGRGPAIWLTGVSHIGESNYFAGLQRQLDGQTLVLFEGIGAASGQTAETSASSTSAARPDAKAAGISSNGTRRSLQSSLATSLGLVFQLEAIDYDRTNFRNSDLSVEQLRGLIARQPAGAGEAGAGQSFESLLQILEGGSLLDAVLQVGLRFLGANPKLQAMSKLALIETIAQMKGDPSQLRGLPSQMKQLLAVLIEQRNQKVVDDLKAELREMSRDSSIAVFYGTGHMPDLEMRLRKQLKYKPADQQWLTPFSVNLAQAGISQAELEFIRGFVKRELEQLH